MRGGSEASIPAGDVLAPSGRMLLAAEIGGEPRHRPAAGQLCGRQMSGSSAHTPATGAGHLPGSFNKATGACPTLRLGCTRDAVLARHMPRLPGGQEAPVGSQGQLPDA